MIIVAAPKQVMPPQHYASNWEHYIDFNPEVDIDHVKYVISRLPEESKPNYVVFYGKEGIPKKLMQMQEHFPNMEFVQKYEPGTLDQILHFLNDKNALEEAHIYTLPESDIKHLTPE
ncbi:MAG: hypothetical protein HRT74_12350 [Flavobacteriales bacterium]|nr:hypothetical protein [Flavobacteriales bacterium]